MTRPIELRSTAKLTVTSDVHRQIPQAMFDWGIQFMAAAYDLSDKAYLRGVRTYLIGHAIELLLKSFLLTKGISIETLASKKYGHDLEKLLQRAESHGFAALCPISDEARNQLKTFNPLYRGKHFEYFSIAHLIGGVDIEIEHLLVFQKQMLNPIFEIVNQFSTTRKSTGKAG